MCIFIVLIIGVVNGLIIAICNAKEIFRLGLRLETSKICYDFKDNLIKFHLINLINCDMFVFR